MNYRIRYYDRNGDEALATAFDWNCGSDEVVRRFCAERGYSESDIIDVEEVD